MQPLEDEDLSLLQELIDDHLRDPNYFTACPTGPSTSSTSDTARTSVPDIASLARDEIFKDSANLSQIFREEILKYFHVDNWLSLSDEKIREALFAMNCLTFELSYFIQIYFQLKNK